MATTSEIFVFLKILTTPGPTEGSHDHSSAENKSASQRLDVSLGGALTAVNKSLKSGKVKTTLPEEVVAELASLTSDPGSDIRWQHVRCCLLLVRTLHSHLTEEMRAFTESQKTETRWKPSDAPPLPPDTISIGHQKVLTTALQFVITMGICPHLSPAVGIPLELRLGFSRIISRPTNFSGEETLNRLYEVVSTLLSCVTVPSLGGVILTKHLGDLLASLLQMLHEPRKDSKDEGTKEALHKRDRASTETGIDTERPIPVERREFCQTHLDTLLQRAYQPSIMKELLLLQGGPGRRPGKNTTKNHGPRAPGWLREVSGRLLMERVVQKHGVQHLLRAVLDASGQESSPRNSSLDWQRCDAVARILTEYKSTSVTEEEYFKAIYPQILELLEYNDQLILQQVLRVCCTTIGEMMKKQPELTQKHLIAPLQAPLLRTLVTSPLPDDVADDMVTVATEDALTKCLENVCKVYLEGSEPSSITMATIHPVLNPLFCMYSALKDSVWVLRPVVERLLSVSLQSCDHSTAVELLASITRVKGHEKYPSMHQDVEFTLGPSGSAVAVYRPQKSSDERFTDSVVQGEQSAVCCTELLMAGKGKLDRLAADFFLLVLKELTAVLDSSEDSEFKPSCKPEEFLLQVESHQQEGISHIQHSLRVLSLVSSLCEKLGPTVLQSLDHMIEFGHATLERACKHLGTETESTGGLEAETVMFAFGLLSAIIGGSTEKKVTRDNRKSLSSLLPLLEKISSEHPSETLRQMAGDLRIAIATHGAVQAERLLESQDNLREKDISKRKGGRKKGRIEDLGSVHNSKRGSKENLDKPSENVSELPSVCSTDRGSIEDGLEARLSSEKVESVEAKAGSPIPQHRQEHTFSSAATDKDCLEAGSGDRYSNPYGKGRSKDTVVEDEEIHMQNSVKDNLQTTIPSNNHIANTETDTRKTGGEESKAFDEAFEELFDPLVPVRGHALIALSRLLQEKDPKALQQQGTLLKLFLEHLIHEDSYVYLTAIGALVSLADRFPGEVMPSLCAEYSADEAEGDCHKRSKVKRTVETRLKVGEALVKATRMLGDMAPHYSRQLLNAFLSGVKDVDGDVRASSLSNLGEVCQLLKFSLAGCVSEIFHCLSSILQCDPEVPVRRACILVISLLLRGLGTDALQVLESEMRDLYRLLKLLHSREKDDVMRLHVQLALEELDILMRKFLFPEQTLSKKITVLP